MRVLHLAASGVSLSRFVLPLLPRMTSLGHTPILATRKEDDLDLDFQGWPLVDLEINRGWQIPSGMLHAAQNTNKLLQVQPDVVVVHTPATALSARRSLQELKARGVTLIYVARGSLHESSSLSARIAWRFGDPMSWNLWDGVLTVSKSLERAALRHLPARPVTNVSLSAAAPNVPSEVLAPSADPFTPSEVPRLGWVGRFDRDKRPQDMVQLVKTLEHEFRIEVEVALIGAATKGDRASKIPSHPRVTELGWIEHPCLVLRNCDLNIMTSLREGYALSPLEAALVGTPTIAYRNSGTIDSVPEVGGELVAAKDVSGLAAHLHHYATSKLEYKLQKRATVRQLAINLMQDADPAAEMVDFIRKASA